MFSLPRKLKIGFASGEYDDLMAQVQDLGFVAIRNDAGEPGFRVYGGGGMGRESAVAVKLFDFIPLDQVIRCSLAMTNLFFDHGDRGNRNQARIRFIVKRFGPEEFRKLFLNYYEEAAQTAPKCIPDTTVLEIAEYTGCTEEESGFSLWVKKAVTPTSPGNDIVSVCLYVPGGNLSSQHLRQLAALTKCGAAPCFRLTRTQDILIPKVRKAALPEIYRILRQELQDIDLTGISFKGHIVSCVGCTVCKIGILDAPDIANNVAAELDDLFKEEPEKQAESFPRIVKALRISGCPNSCAAHPAAKIGVQGSKKKLNDKLEEVGTIYTRQTAEPLGTTDEVFLPTAEIPAKIRAMVEESVAANAL
jgi:sulfite reductase beta subunit-like hemoprotein